MNINKKTRNKTTSKTRHTGLKHHLYKRINPGVIGLTSLTVISSFLFAGFIYTNSDDALSANALKGQTGDAAIKQLSNRLPNVASRYFISSESLKDLLKKDSSLRVSDKDELFYVEPGLTQEEIIMATKVVNSPPEPSETELQNNNTLLENAFDLHSKVDSNKTLYLDFDGHTSSDEHWTKYNAGYPVISAPYDHDGFPETFSASERQSIIDIWASVAEDFSHLDINVTTKDLGTDALIKSNSADTKYGNRTVITPSNFYSSSAGGVSYVGTWGTTKDYVSYVFICCDVPVTKYIAEATSHESGHSVGLHHDGTASEAYYGGHGDWAPIMGVGYYKPLTQWSKGEYQGANQKQDDLTFPLRYGISSRIDDVANTTSKATLLDLKLPGDSRTGLIGSSTDKDVYSFDWPGGNIDFEIGSAVSVQNFSNVPGNAHNLDPSVRLLNRLSVAEAESNPDGPTNARITKFLLPGKYYLEIKGSGYLDPLTSGYSNYSSIGQYKIIRR